MSYHHRRPILYIIYLRFSFYQRSHSHVTNFYLHMYMYSICTHKYSNSVLNIDNYHNYLNLNAKNMILDLTVSLSIEGVFWQKQH